MALWPLLARISFIVLFCGVATASSSHFSDTSPRRTIVLSAADGHLIAHVRLPVPLLLARDLDWARTVAAPVASGLVVTSQTELLFDPGGAARAPTQFQALLEGSHLWQVGGRSVAPKLLAYRFDVDPADGPFGTAQEARQTLALPSLAVAMPLGLSTVEFQLDLGPAAPRDPVLVSTAFPSLAVPGWETVDTLLIDSRGATPVAIMRHGTLQAPERVDSTPASVMTEHLLRGLGRALPAALLPLLVVAALCSGGRRTGLALGVAAVGGVVAGYYATPPNGTLIPAWGLQSAIVVIVLALCGLRLFGRTLPPAALVVTVFGLAGLAQAVTLRLDGLASYHAGAIIGLGLGVAACGLAGIAAGLALGRRVAVPRLARVGTVLVAALAATPIWAARSGSGGATALSVTDRIGQAASWASAGQLQPSLAELMRDIHLACAHPSGSGRTGALAALFDPATATGVDGSACAALAGGGLGTAGPPLHEIDFAAIGLVRQHGDLSVNARWTALALVDPASHVHSRGSDYAADLRLSETATGWRITDFALSEVDRSRAGEIVARPSP